jgi:serine/threonine protein kinase
MHITKTSSPELLSNETEILLLLQGIQGIPSITVSPLGINMKKYDLIPYSSMDLIDIQQWLFQLSRILRDMHSRKVVHLDLSMQNILQDQGHVMLIDFALSKRLDQIHPHGCGTPGYIAPEVYTDEQTYCASDIYSMGIVLGQMLEPYLPGCSLHYLGSKLVRHPTTTFIGKQLQTVLLEKSLDGPPILYEACDLLSKCFLYEHTDRITAQGILEHPFVQASADLFRECTRDHVAKRYMRASSRPKREPIVFYRG